MQPFPYLSRGNNLLKYSKKKFLKLKESLKTYSQSQGVIISLYFIEYNSLALLLTNGFELQFT